MSAKTTGAIDRASRAERRANPDGDGVERRRGSRGTNGNIDGQRSSRSWSARGWRYDD